MMNLFAFIWMSSVKPFFVKMSVLNGITIGIPWMKLCAEWDLEPLHAGQRGCLPRQYA